MSAEQKEQKVCSRLKARRLEMDITQNELAERAGLERKTINRIEMGHYSPSIKTLFMLCSAMRFKPAEVLEGL